MPQVGLSRKEEALRRLGVQQSDLERVPPLSLILGDVSSRKQIIAAMRFSADPTCIQFLKTYDEVPKGDIKSVPLEAVAAKSGVNVMHLIGAIIVCFKSIQAQKSGLMAMANHPKVLKSTIDFAQLPGGDRDRRMLHEAIGFLPTPKGSTLNVNLNGLFGQAEPEKRETEKQEVTPDVNEVFPMITETQSEWQQNRSKLLAEKN